MNIDFSVNIKYWTDLIKEFFDVISGFLAGFGIKLFKDSETAE